MIRRPGPAWVYRCFDSTGRLIYVGSTVDVFGRLAAHRRDAWWAPQIAKVTAKVHPGQRAALDAEVIAIRAENPRWNIQYRWTARDTWGPGDFEDYIHALVNKSRGEPSIPARTRRHMTRAGRLYTARFGAVPLHLRSLLAA